MDENTLNYDTFDLNNFNDIVFDVAISNADARLFDNIITKKKFLISYSIQSLEKFIRKKQLIAYLKHRPTILVLGEYHKSIRSKVTSIFGVNILPLGVDDIFLNTKLSINIDNNLAIFTSRTDRNSDLLIDIWNNKIQPKDNNFKLLITPKIKNNLNPNIIERSLSTRENLINDLLKSRIFLVPGHRAELFCLAAEEARELCLPIVTLGIGCLSERVDHEKTGFIAKNENEFVNYTIELFKNDKLWNQMRSDLIKLRGSVNWINATNNLLKIIS